MPHLRFHIYSAACKFQVGTLYTILISCLENSIMPLHSSRGHLISSSTFFSFSFHLFSKTRSSSSPLGERERESRSRHTRLDLHLNKTVLCIITEDRVKWQQVRYRSRLPCIHQHHASGAAVDVSSRPDHGSSFKTPLKILEHSMKYQSCAKCDISKLCLGCC